MFSDVNVSHDIGYCSPVLIELCVFFADSIKMNPDFCHLLPDVVDLVDQGVLLERHRCQLIVDLVALDRSAFQVGFELIEQHKISSLMLNTDRLSYE